MQVVIYLSIVVKLALSESCSIWETSRNQICFIPGLLSTLLLFLLYCLLFQCFKAKGKAWLVFCPTHPPLFSPWKSMYELSFYHSLSCLILFSNSWAPWQIWDQRFTSMGDLIIFSKPALCYIWIAPHALKSLMYVIYSATYYDIGLAIVHWFNTA